MHISMPFMCASAYERGYTVYDYGRYAAVIIELG